MAECKLARTVALSLPEARKPAELSITTTDGMHQVVTLNYSQIRSLILSAGEVLSRMKY
jgi:hypothetical protein